MLWGAVHLRLRCYYICRSRKQRMDAYFVTEDKWRLVMFWYMWKNGVTNSGPTDEVETSGQNTGTFKGRNVWQIRHIVHFDVKYQEYFQRHLRQHPTLIKRTPEGSGNLTDEPLLSEVLSRTAASVLCCKSRWIRDGINPCLISPPFSSLFFHGRSFGHGFRETAAVNKAQDSPLGTEKVRVSKNNKSAGRARLRWSSQTTGREKNHRKYRIYSIYTTY